jgi:hypothetical protein
MPFSGMSGRVPIVRTDISEEHIASILRMERMSDLGTTLPVTSSSN